MSQLGKKPGFHSLIGLVFPCRLSQTPVYLFLTVPCPQCPPSSLLLCPLSLLLSCRPSVFLYLSVSPSISVPVLVLAICRLTDGPLFAVLSYLSGGVGGGLMCLEWLLPSSLWLSRSQFSCRSRPRPKVILRLNWKHLGDAWMTS